MVNTHTIKHPVLIHVLPRILETWLVKIISPWINLAWHCYQEGVAFCRCVLMTTLGD